MATPTYREPRSAGIASGMERRTFLGGYVFGAPVGDLGWFASLLIGLATGMMAFFLGTFAGIVGILVGNGMGNHWDFAWSYRRVGFPVGVTVMVLAVKRITRSR